MENGRIPVELARRLAALDVSVKIFGAIMALGIAAKDERFIAVTAGRYFLTGRH